MLYLRIKHNICIFLSLIFYPQQYFKSTPLHFKERGSALSFYLLCLYQMEYSAVNMFFAAWDVVIAY